MNGAAALALTAAGALGGATAVGLLCRNRAGVDTLAVLFTATIAFFTFVLGAYLATGYANLVSGAATVSTTDAALAAAIALAGLLAGMHFARLPVLSTVTSGCALLAEGLRDAARALVSGPQRWPALAVCVFVAALALINLATGFPRGTEGAAYHLPHGLVALQSGSLRIPDSVFYSALPANAGLWYILVLQLTTERFVALGQLPFLVLLALAVYGISRRAGAEPHGAAIATCGLLTIPVISLQALQAESDIAGLAFIAIALYLILSDRLPAPRYLLAGFAIGLAFGFKSLYTIAGTLLVALALAQPWWRRDTAPWPGRENLRNTGALIAAALFVASFWLVRNATETGNPLYPVHVAGIFDMLGWPAPHDIDFDGHRDKQFLWVRSSWEWAVYPWIEWFYADAGPFYRSNSGLGAFAAAVLPAAAAHVLLRSGTRRSAEPDERLRLLLLLSGALLLLAWFVLGAREPRYASAAWPFLLPLTGYASSTLRGRPQTVFNCVCWICIIWMFTVMAAKELVTFGDRVVYSRQTTRDRYYEYPPAVDRLPPGSTIVNLADRSSTYPLAGIHHGNRVIKFVRSLRLFGIRASQRGYDVAIYWSTRGIALDAARLRALGATHVYVRSSAPIGLDDCVRLVEVDRLERMAGNGVRIVPPRVLYRIDYCERPGG